MPRFVLETLAVAGSSSPCTCRSLNRSFTTAKAVFWCRRAGSSEDIADVLAERLMDVREAIDAGEMILV